MISLLEITPQEANNRLALNGAAKLVDVREPSEFAVAQIPNSQLIPMSTLPAQMPLLRELAEQSELLILCHHGVRSLQVVRWLRNQGIENCYSVAGGIDRWSHEINPGVPRY